MDWTRKVNPVRRVKASVICLLVSLLAAVAWTSFAATSLAAASPVAFSATQVTIVVPKDCSARETLAAREVMRYFYLRTGVVVPIRNSGHLPKADAIVISQKD